MICECNSKKYNDLTENIPSDGFVGIIKIDMPGFDDLDDNTLRQKDILPLIDTFRFVKLELTDESLIGDIDKLDVFEDRIYIMDMQTSSLFVFDINGKYLFKIDDIGQGPQEYIQLDFFDIDRKKRQLVLTDLMGYRILRYDMDGNFISKHEIPFRVEWTAPVDGGYSMYANYRDNSDKFNKEYNLFIMDSTMNIKKNYFPYNSSVFNNPRMKFSPTGIFYYYNDSCRFLSTHYSTLYDIDINGLRAKYRFDFGEHTFDPDILSGKREKIDLYLNDQSYYMLSFLTENDSLLNFAYTLSSFPIFFYGYFSKNSGNIIYSAGFTIGESEYFRGHPLAAYDSWFISELRVGEMLEWKEDVKKKGLKTDSKWIKEKKIALENITEDDNPVLILYKLKPF
jgi:hypothetical protein